MLEAGGNLPAKISMISKKELFVCNLQLGMTSEQVLKVTGKPQVQTEKVWRFLSGRGRESSVLPEELEFEDGVLTKIIRGRRVSIYGREVLDGNSPRSLIERTLGPPDGYTPGTFKAFYKAFDLLVTSQELDAWYTLSPYGGSLIVPSALDSAIRTSGVQRKPRKVVKVVSSWIESNAACLDKESEDRVCSALNTVIELCDSNAPAEELNRATQRLEEIFAESVGFTVWSLKPRRSGAGQ